MTFLTIPLEAIGAVGLLFCLSLMWRRSDLHQTTLTGPRWWTAVCLAWLAITELLVLALADDAAARLAQPLRLIAASGTFCPLMSVLGAKRPQDRGWHFVVASLWIIVALPAIEGWFLGAGGQVELSTARRWFLLILIGLGMLNYLPTRHWLAALLTAAGQAVLWGEYLPLVQLQSARSVGPPLLLAALLVTLWVAKRKRACSGVERAWLDFRDLFGGLWSLRILERVNAAGRMYDWPITLTWLGFSSPPADLSASQQAELRQTMVNLLRRFVSAEWIADRLPD